MTERAGGSVARGFLFADLRGYSGFVERLGDRAGAELLGTYRELVRRSTARFDGAEIRTEGDSFYLVFGSPSSAVLCGLEIVAAAAGTKTPSGHPIEVGIGVHAGETISTDEGYVGSAVNIAARVCAAAAPGEVLVTDTVRSLIRTVIDVRFIAVGRRRLKGIPEPIALWRALPTTSATDARRLQRMPVLASRSLLLGAAVALVIVVASALALLRGGAAREEQPAGATQSPSRGAAPTAAAVAQPVAAAEEALLSRLDREVAAGCESADAEDAPLLQYGGSERGYSGPMAVEAGVICDLQSTRGADTVWYWLATQNWAPDEFFFQTVGRARLPEGDCSQTDSVWGKWEFGGREGNVLCTTSERDARIIWTYAGERIVGMAVREDSDARMLYEWWRDHARTLRSS